MIKKQREKIENDVNRLLDGKRINGLNLSLLDIKLIVDLLKNLKNKPEFMNGNVKKFCDKYGIEVYQYGMGWKVR